MSVCLSMNISQEPHIETSPNFLCALPVAVACGFPLVPLCTAFKAGLRFFVCFWSQHFDIKTLCLTRSVNTHIHQLMHKHCVVSIRSSLIRPAAPYLPHRMPYVPAPGMFFPPPMHPMMPHMYMQMSESQLTNQQPAFTTQPPPPRMPNLTVKVFMQITTST